MSDEHAPGVKPEYSEDRPEAADAPPPGKTQTVFIHKLYDMLHDDLISHLIWWLATNDLFCLLPGEDFSKELLQYFKHTNIALFIRQLNMYGFHKVNDTFQLDGDHKDGATRWEFRHLTNQFRKGDVDLLKLIKRRSLKNVNSHKEIVNLLSIPTLAPMEYYPVPMPGQPPHPQPHPAAIPGQLPGQLPPGHLAPAPQPLPMVGQPGQPHPHPHHVHYDEEAEMLRRALAEAHGTPLMQHRPLYPGAPQLPQQPLLPAAPPLPGSQRPLLVTQNLFERLLNFRFIEVNNQIGALRNDLVVALARNDQLAAELRRSQQDTLRVVDLLEKYLEPAAAASGPGGPPAHASPDRHQNKTPVLRAPADEQSPMLGTAPPPPAAAFAHEIRGLRTQVLQRIEAMQHYLPTPPPPQAYHLTKPPLRQPLGTQINIVPQNYPLNPNYALYQQDSFRAKVASELRHRLVLMDPLQPIPSRKNLTILIDDVTAAATAQSAPPQPAPPTIAAGTRLRAELKLYLPLLVANQHLRTLPRPPLPQSNSQHGYPFPVMEKTMLVLLILLSHAPLTRTNLLPVTGASNENPNYHYQQRNLFTLMYDLRSLTSVPTITFAQPPPMHHLPLQGLRPLLAVNKLPAINPIRLVLPTNPGHNRIPLPLLTTLPRLVPADHPKEKSKNTLPSVLELDKLIKLALRPFLTLPTAKDGQGLPLRLLNLGEDDRELKKRKMNETPV